METNDYENRTVLMVAQPRRAYGLTSLVFVGLPPAVILINLERVAASFGGGSSIAYFLIPVVLVLVLTYFATTTLVSRTIFFEDSIQRISPFLTRRSWSYQEVEKVEFGNGASIRISFSDGFRLYVFRSEADLGEVYGLLSEKCHLTVL